MGKTLQLVLPIFFAGTLVMIYVMTKTGAPLKTLETPGGIVDLEFAYNKTQANIVLDAWKIPTPKDLIAAAKHNTYLDFIFIFFYAGFLFTLSKYLTGFFKGLLTIVGRYMATAALLAGLFDVIENIGMLATLNDHQHDLVLLFTFLFSLAKWLLVAAVAGYSIVASLILLYRKFIDKNY